MIVESRSNYGYFVVITRLHVAERYLIFRFRKSSTFQVPDDERRVESVRQVVSVDRKGIAEVEQFSILRLIRVLSFLLLSINDGDLTRKNRDAKIECLRTTKNNENGISRNAEKKKTRRWEGRRFRGCD